MHACPMGHHATVIVVIFITLMAYASYACKPYGPSCNRDWGCIYNSHAAVTVTNRSPDPSCDPS